MKLGIISDSHDSHTNVAKAVKIFNDENVDYVLHAGDIISPDVARAFAQLQKAKFIAVFGNCDRDKASLKDTISEFGGQVFEQHYRGKIENRRIYMTHSPDIAETIASSGEYDLVVHGHTHDPVIRKVDKTLVIDPGTSMRKVMTSSYIVILDLADMTTRLVSLK